MERARRFKVVGITLLCAGALMVVLGLSGGAAVFRIAGPIVGFLGIVLLAQAGTSGDVRP